MRNSEVTAFDTLIEALETRAASDNPVKFWLRDDDAVHPSESLEQLLRLCERFAVPLMLAVIPEKTCEKLSDRLATSQNVVVTLHGWSHVNHAAEGEKSQELGDHRPVDDTLAELRQGIHILSTLHPHRFVPVLVPPWNRISQRVVERLNDLGIKAVSVFGEQTLEQHKPSSMTFANTHVDIIDWRGTRGGRPVEELVAEMVMQVQQGRSTIGVLSHHLVHDEAAWVFLAKLFAVTTVQPGCRWVSIHDLLY